ncbi:MAG: hypothetical protein ACRDHX_11750 [Chloroflexota bacterium]
MGHEKSATELTVELTIAWLKRVEGTADGREPREVIQAMDEFFEAVSRYRRTEHRGPEGAEVVRPEPEPAGIAP